MFTIIFIFLVSHIIPINHFFSPINCNKQPLKSTSAQFDASSHISRDINFSNKYNAKIFDFIIG